MERKSKTDSSRNANTIKRPSVRAWPLDVRLALSKAVVDEGLSAMAAAKPGNLGEECPSSIFNCVRGRPNIGMQPDPYCT